MIQVKTSLNPSLLDTELREMKINLGFVVFLVTYQYHSKVKIETRESTLISVSVIHNCLNS